MSWQMFVSYFFYDLITLYVLKLKKGENVFYKKMYNEYYSNEQRLKIYILYLKEKYSEDLKKEDIQICRRISILYDMYLNLKYVTNLLKSRSKYEEHNGKNFKI